VSSISSASPSSGPAYSSYVSRQQPVRPIARVRSQSESDSSSLTLKVKTAEGDTVELSIDAQSLTQFQSATARSRDGKVSAASANETDSLNVKLSVKGNLNDQEVSDIKSLLESLSSGQPLQSPLSSLSAYQGSYSQTASRSNSTLTLYG
jgi:hypothetical protein